MLCSFSFCQRTWFTKELMIDWLYSIHKGIYLYTYIYLYIFIHIIGEIKITTRYTMDNSYN